MASECMRIRLPWPRKSFAALSDFASYKQVLANLKSDPALFTYLNNLTGPLRKDCILLAQR